LQHNIQRTIYLLRITQTRTIMTMIRTANPALPPPIAAAGSVFGLGVDGVAFGKIIGPIKFVEVSGTSEADDVAF
jgi:hypothetical protein